MHTSEHTKLGSTEKRAPRGQVHYYITHRDNLDPYQSNPRQTSDTARQTKTHMSTPNNRGSTQQPRVRTTRAGAAIEGLDLAVGTPRADLQDRRFEPLAHGEDRVATGIATQAATGARLGELDISDALSGREEGSLDGESDRVHEELDANEEGAAAAAEGVGGQSVPATEASEQATPNGQSEMVKMMLDHMASMQAAQAAQVAKMMDQMAGITSKNKSREHDGGDDKSKLSKYGPMKLRAAF